MIRAEPQVKPPPKASSSRVSPRFILPSRTAVSGASGVGLAKKFIDYLPEEVELFVVVSDSAKRVIEKEERVTDLFFEDQIESAISSGSFRVDATAVIPCSMNTLAKIACGIADNLTTRVASVAIKEMRKLLLAPREMPFSYIALENMKKLSSIGVVIAPPVMGYYSDSDTLEDMERFVIGKWYDALGIEHDIYRRWGE